MYTCRAFGVLFGPQLFSFEHPFHFGKSNANKMLSSFIAVWHGTCISGIPKTDLFQQRGGEPCEYCLLPRPAAGGDMWAEVEFSAAGHFGFRC
jgi:hypothetical protein